MSVVHPRAAEIVPRLDSLETQVAGLQERHDEIRTNIDYFKEELTHLNRTVTGLDEGMDANTRSIKVIEVRTESLKDIAAGVKGIRIVARLFITIGALAGAYVGIVTALKSAG